jgi:hypothetical protein
MVAAKKSPGVKQKKTTTKLSGEVKKRAKARTSARHKRIAEILERTRKGRAFFEELARGAEDDLTPVTAPWHNVSMPRDESTTIEVAETFYAQVVARAVNCGVKPEKLLEILVNRALDRADQRTHEAVRSAKTKVLCDCCSGPCKSVLTWRGIVRCGCPAAKSPSPPRRVDVESPPKFHGNPATESHVYMQSVLEPKKGCALCKRPESDSAHDVGF